MEFEFDNRNVKDRNIFYFKYYCESEEELQEWLKYHSIMKIFKEFYIAYNNGGIDEEEFESWTELYKELYYDWKDNLRHFIWSWEYDNY